MELETEIIPLFFGLNDLEERIMVQWSRLHIPLGCILFVLKFWRQAKVVACD